MDNLRLPLCPKCGDTKHVKDGGVELSVKLGNNYYCSECKVEWSSYPPRIRDEHGVVHNFGSSSGSELIREVPRKLNVKWTYEAGIDLPTVWNI